ncbi:unnamed protein product [Rhizophagus irregularis]|nr:unnamed protein product [Rhizophagus irregularis]
MVEPTNDELNEALNKLSNNKASGPTIPLEWKYANVYPIPKPKPWGCQLVNTRCHRYLPHISRLNSYSVQYYAWFRFYNLLTSRSLSFISLTFS